ncbi:hypothetical protein HYW82_04450 [Candidatus Peregrinibacteria bacterium]|nr:hypothetical protein [Candidatus Peregrinibacteria bacterium]
MQNFRILSYDVFRGILLIGMVVFHVLVNLTSFRFNQELFYWVPLGFVLFLGVILARFLTDKFLKKIKLAAKLLIIFLAFNIPNFLHNDIHFSDFIIGSSRLFSFEILMPMVLVIMLSLLLDKIKKSGLMLCFLFPALIALNYSGIDSYNLLFTIYGLIGYFVGKNFDLNGYAKNKLSFAAAILFSAVPFFIIQYFQLFDFIVVAQVLAMYFLCKFLLGNNHLMAELGRYSLFLYVAHIVLIKGFAIIVS